VNLALIRFAGPVVCTVNRADVEYNESVALDQWIQARQGGAPAGPETQPSAAGADAPQAALASGSATMPATPPPVTVALRADQQPSQDSPLRSLRDLLSADLAVRLGLPEDELQINFNPADQKALNLSEPQFKFNIDGRNIHNLGPVNWEVLVVTDSGSKKVMINASARAWQNQVVLTRPLSFKQVVQAADVRERRMLADRISDEPLLTAEQVVGQQAANDLKPGTVLTARMVDPVPLVRGGQFVTITLIQGNVRVKTVARAMDGGAYGQSIKVKNEATKDVYDVVITGPQEGTVGPLPTKVASIREQ
jgi:flagella basal body P-ring formation protein FlgA